MVANEHIFEPFGAVEPFLYCQDPEVCIHGPAGTGKSRGVFERAMAMLLRYHGMRALFCRKTRASMTETTLVTWENHVLPHTSLFDSVRDGPQRSHRRGYSFPNGSEVIVAGLDNTSKIMSAEYDLIVVDEATELTLDDWEMLTTRLRNGVVPYQQIIAACNPGAPTHWLRQRMNEGITTEFASRYEDNPTMWDHAAGDWTPKGAEYIAKLDKLSGARHARLRLGQWAAAEGIVYDRFDRAVHVVAPFDVPENWTRIRSIDFGFVDPFVCQWWALDHDHRMYLYREIYHTGRLVEEHARDIIAATGDEKIAVTVCDHDAEDRATLAKHGVYTVPAKKAITVGIQAVMDRLVVQEDRKPRIMLMDGVLVERDQDLAEDAQPLCTVEEFDSYIWPEAKDDRNSKEVPVDKFNHGMDTMRYAVMHADTLGRGKQGRRRKQTRRSSRPRIFA